MNERPEDTARRVYDLILEIVTRSETHMNRWSADTVEMTLPRDDIVYGIAITVTRGIAEQLRACLVYLVEYEVRKAQERLRAEAAA